jgi:hypothetical protein
LYKNVDFADISARFTANPVFFAVIRKSSPGECIDTPHARDRIHPLAKQLAVCVCWRW